MALSLRYITEPEELRGQHSAQLIEQKRCVQQKSRMQKHKEKCGKSMYIMWSVRYKLQRIVMDATVLSSGSKGKEL